MVEPGDDDEGAQGGWKRDDGSIETFDGAEVVKSVAEVLEMITTKRDGGKFQGSEGGREGVDRLIKIG